MKNKLDQILEKEFGSDWRSKSLSGDVSISILQTVYKEISKALPTHNPSFMTRGEVKEVLRRVLEVRE